MAKEKQNGTVADKGKKKLTTSGKEKENPCPVVQVLRERNTGVVIRDEHDIMRLREDDACANDDVEGVPPRVTQPFICSTSIPSTSYAPQRPTPTSELFQEDACSEDGMEGFPSRVNAQCPISPCRHFLGKMNVLCPNCKAWHWMDEKLTTSSKKKPLFGTCCLQGKVRLPLLIIPPPPLQALYDGNDDQSKSFRTHTREYNAANAFTSLGATLDTRVLSGRGPTSFTIHGELRHRTGSLLPVPRQQASYAQRYIYDPNSAVEVCTHRNPHLRRDVLQTIQDSLLQVNAFVGKFRHAYAVLNQLASTGQNLPAHLHYSSSKDRRRYNVPTIDEIAVVIPGDGTEDLTDVGIDDIGPDQIGQMVVLPSSFIGSPRHMFENFQDSMAITRYNHHPDIFLTMTANPKWPEITASLLPHQNAIDRPDLVARVFELKRKALMKEIEQNNVFGKKVAHVFTIEFQKCGLPHMHTLLFLQGPDKIRTCAQVDNLVSAEFPDPQDDPELFETVKCCMVHGPCGARNPQSPCMVDGKCSKRYPRDFVESTTMDQDGYPVYRRRRSDKVHTVRGQPVDNRDVVPYNAYLSRRFNCHINVEVCAGMRCVKYIHKYIYKGYDCTTMVLGSINEIQQYLDARYIGPPEAAWRIFGHHLHEEVPAVARLALHLPGMHQCAFNPKDTLEQIRARASLQKSTLTGFFEWYTANPNAEKYTYQEFPQFFVWDKSNKRWTPRISGFAIGRMYFASPNCGERFYMRLLLTVVKVHICDDIAHKIRTCFPIPNPSDAQIEDYGLYLLDQMLQESGRTLSDFPPMPQPIGNWSAVVGNRLVLEHQHLQIEAQQVDVQVDIDRLNNAQCKAYDAITSSVLQNRGRIFFVSGGAGTGKTFLYNTIALKCRSLGHIVVTVASSGIASLLLVEGRTAHSTFCIPLDVMENSICVFSKQSIQAELFRQTKLIIWDEVPMQHKHCVEAVDRTLRDICNCEKPFGGITVVLGGDFRQILPVITKGVREQIVNASLRHSVLWKEINVLWKEINVLTLNVNMRLDQADQGNVNFAKLLLELHVVGTSTPKFLTERTILSARDEDVSSINIAAMNIFPGEAFTYLAADRICEEDEIDRTISNCYPNEFLNSLDPPGLPPFKVELKVGCPIMLLRNIAPKAGLCNGIRLMVVGCASRIIEALILSGEKFGNLAFIPRITLTPSSSEFPFRMTRRQFPIRLAYALTINKSQGQSVKFVGVDLRTPVFSHGQLYVALSRCTSFDRISVLLSKDELDFTTNIVYPEVLL
ncbi:hypothetical protein RHMOL_Rhmol08G0224500 [Rhododendron molle]|uniref:Uncharacterized protein n=1 Tax=Rhododendron molle TaxID=49168 RepID=A0ACC0MRB6_RHOML|nr:hypothetical protein RHMOL_Rhmol08G0224500 [Rhododendron molle]